MIGERAGFTTNQRSLVQGGRFNFPAAVLMPDGEDTPSAAAHACAPRDIATGPADGNLMKGRDRRVYQPNPARPCALDLS